jgi:hypothetical protein
MFGPNISRDDLGQFVLMPMSLARKLTSLVEALKMPKLAPAAHAMRIG